MKKLALINQQFIKAAQSNQIDELKNLLDQGADIHANDDEALKWSAEIGNLKVVKFLVLPDLGSVAITHGANIHTDDDYALRLSAYFGHLETVKFLVTQGANIHAKNDEVLKGSSKNGHYDVRQALLAFIQEEKLLVAASVSTSASRCFCGTSGSLRIYWCQHLGLWHWFW